MADHGYSGERCDDDGQGRYDAGWQEGYKAGIADARQLLGRRNPDACLRRLGRLLWVRPEHRPKARLTTTEEDGDAGESA